MAEAVRVALLARPGEAREQLRRALADLGAALVAEGDPSELDPATVAGAKPTVVLVSLEPAIEDALSRFDQLLSAPGVEVMYDDAEVTRQLDGWDLARWARHLAAKLAGGDVLPPAPGGADTVPDLDLTPEPGAPPTPAQEMDHARLEDYAAESLDLAEWVPSEPSLAAAPAAPTAVRGAAPADELALGLDIGDLEQALGRADAEVRPEPRGGGDAEDLAFDPDAFDIDLSALPGENAPMAVASGPAEPTPAADGPLLADLALSDEPVNFSSFSEDEPATAGSLDDDVAALAAQLEAFEAQDQRGQAREPDFATDSGKEESLALDDDPGPDLHAAAPAAPAAPPAAPPAVARSAGFGELSLAPMDDAAAPAAARAAAPARPSSGLTLSLEGEVPPADAPIPARPAAPGALLVLAGLGGPDAVRQLLGALSDRLPVPVLLYQHLDTGKHDRLVGQLGKASRLPLDLAEAGKLAPPGRVAVLPPGLGLEVAASGPRFTAGGDLAGVLAALPAKDAVVVVLSGADPALVAPVLALRRAGALVLAQDPASCFDPAAADALIAAGIESFAPAELAAPAQRRWP